MLHDLLAMAIRKIGAVIGNLWWAPFHAAAVCSFGCSRNDKIEGKAARTSQQH